MPPDTSDDNRLAFGVFPPADESGIGIIAIGVPQACYIAMTVSEETHHLDLRPAGLPLILAVFAGKDRAECLAALDTLAKERGATLIEEDRGIQDAPLNQEEENPNGSTK